MPCKNLIFIVFTCCLSSMLMAQNSELPPDLKIGKHTVAEWQYMVDTTWGEGLPTADKLVLFDNCWEAVDKFYPGFINLDLDWDSIRNHYRPEIAAGVSRGRFAAILWQLSLALKEIHSGFSDMLFVATELHPDMPVMIYRHNRTGITPGYADDGWFGATVTPVDEDLLVVLKCIPEHPLGLQPGDQIIGYDGSSWKNLYPLLLQLELPQQVNSIMGTEEAHRHNLLSGVGMNWHLFETIDIKKAGSTDTLHLSTSLLETEKQSLFASEQLPVNGIPFPGDLDHSGMLEDLPNVLYGVVENTNIGYIYVLTTIGEDNAQELSKALNAVLDANTEGLILDLRWNTGGNFSWETGFNQIFNRIIDSCGLYARIPGGDHGELQRAQAFFENTIFTELNEEFLNKPVALLIGPGAGSNGDYMGYFIHEQPMTRSFGKGSSAGWTYHATGENTPSCLTNVDLYNDRFMTWNMGYPDFLSQFAGRNFGRVIDGELVHFLHHCYDIDEDIWFTQDGARNQTDNMVDRAVEWIQSVAYADSIVLSDTYIPAQDGSLDITSKVAQGGAHDKEMHARIYTKSGRFVDQFPLLENAGDWHGTYAPDSEDFYFAEISTHDIDEQSILSYPGKLHFTSAVPPELSPKAVELVTGTTSAVPISLTNVSGIDFGGVSVHFSSIDTDVEINPSDFTYGNINVGDQRKKTFALRIDEASEPHTEYRIDVEISVDNIAYWKDSIMLTSVESTVGLADKLSQKPLIYPNPMDAFCMISMTGNVEIQKIEVCDLSGRILRIEDQIFSNTYRLERQGINRGMYILRVYADETYSAKIVVK